MISTHRERTPFQRGNSADYRFPQGRPGIALVLFFACATFPPLYILLVLACGRLGQFLGQSYYGGLLGASLAFFTLQYVACVLTVRAYRSDRACHGTHYGQRLLRWIVLVSLVQWFLPDNQFTNLLTFLAQESLQIITLRLLVLAAIGGIFGVKEVMAGHTEHTAR